MKLEHVTIDDMLRSYLKSNFANRNTLVIWPLSMCDSEAEVETIKQDGAWLVSRWKLTYRIGWVHICKAVRSAFSDFSNVEILVDQNPVEISNRDDILKLEECGSMIIRGASDIMKSRVMITFYNQLQFVDVHVERSTDEFMEADYQKFNMSFGQYLDSLEIAMHR